jgi:hypothetical protein
MYYTALADEIYLVLYTGWEDPGDDQPGAARQGALDLRPGWSIPQLDELRVN